MSGWLVTGAGGVLVLVGLRDVFQTLFHPTGQGRLSRLTMDVVWRLAHVVGGSGGALGVAGPLAMVAVISLWVVLAVAGWTLVYWPHMPESFAFDSGLAPAERSDLLDSLYVSLVTLSTLGYGDIVPQAAWLRVAAPVQALVGFALLTAAVSWVLQTYPALTRRRTLALRLSMLRRTGLVAELRDPEEPAALALLLDELAVAVLQARVDVSEYTATYYFREADPDASLAVTLVHAVDLAEAAATSSHPAVRAAGSVLARALEDLTRLVDEQHLGVGGGPRQVLAALAADHAHEQEASAM